MMDYITIAVISFLAAVSPGPDFVVVAKNALTHNRYRAIMASLGITVGILLHASYCVFGLALVITESILLFNIIKYSGAIYLIYLGITSILTDGKKISENNDISIVHSGSSWLAFRDGLLTNVLNPKCTLFMLSIFTVVVNPDTPRLIQISYALEICIITGFWFVFLSISLTHPYINTKLSSAQRIINIVMGMALILLGCMVFFKM